MNMIKNLTSNQIILIIMAIVLLLLAAFSFYLLRDPYAPLPFAPPSPSSTFTPLPPSPTLTPEPSFTSSPTRRTSYTPFIPTATKGTETPAPAPTMDAGTSTVTGTFFPQTPTRTTTQAFATPTRTGTLPSRTGTVTPTTTQTLVEGQYLVTGRITRNGTPMANVIVDFADDVAPRLDTTDGGGVYWFTTLAPGTAFLLIFDRTDNPQMTPDPEISPLAWLEGTLPTGVETIQLPDLDLFLDIEGMFYGLQAPADGATYSAAAISSTNPIQFIWSLYYQAESYYVELGQNNNDLPIWTSDDTISTNLMWDGMLDNGLHIIQGTYWWRVSALKSIGNYDLVIYTQESDIIFNP